MMMRSFLELDDDVDVDFDIDSDWDAEGFDYAAPVFAWPAPAQSDAGNVAHLAALPFAPLAR